MTTRQVDTDRPDYDTVGEALTALTRGYPKEPTVEEVVAATSTAGLLRAAYAATHRIHEAASRPAAQRDLRAQRDLITAEVLRRTGDQA